MSYRLPHARRSSELVTLGFPLLRLVPRASVLSWVPRHTVLTRGRSSGREASPETSCAHRGERALTHVPPPTCNPEPVCPGRRQQAALSPRPAGRLLPSPGTRGLTLQTRFVLAFPVCVQSPESDISCRPAVYLRSPRNVPQMGNTGATLWGGKAAETLMKGCECVLRRPQKCLSRRVPAAEPRGGSSQAARRGTRPHGAQRGSEARLASVCDVCRPAS